MATLMITLLVTFVLVLIAMVLLGAGHLIKGKPRLTLGSCGRDPTANRSKKKGCETGPICTICGKTDFDKKEENKDEPLQ